MSVLIERFLEREAASESPLRPDPELHRGALRRRRGRRPRRPSGSTGCGCTARSTASTWRRAAPWAWSATTRAARPTAAAKLAKEGKLQPQLYMLALRDLWKIEPVGGVYVPLAGKDAEPRAHGILDKREKDGCSPASGSSAPTSSSEDALTEALDAAHAAGLRDRGGHEGGAHRPRPDRRQVPAGTAASSRSAAASGR